MAVGAETFHWCLFVLACLALAFIFFINFHTWVDRGGFGCVAWDTWCISDSRRTKKKSRGRLLHVSSTISVQDMDRPNDSNQVDERYSSGPSQVAETASDLSPQTRQNSGVVLLEFGATNSVEQSDQVSSLSCIDRSIHESTSKRGL